MRQPRVHSSLTCFSALLLIVSGCLVSGCHRAPVPAHQIIAGRTMGTSYSVTIVPWDEMPPLRQFSEAIEQELLSVNEQMSTYIETSEVSRFNARQSTDWFEVSSETASVVALALEVSRLTNGAFDTTVGPLVDLWGFGPTGRVAVEPSQEQIAQALAAVGSDKLETRLEPPAIKKSVPGLRIDLSAIAKGHGVDRVAKVLDAMQCKNYFVEIGGEILTRGNRLDGGAWRVGIEKPLENARAIQSVIEISGVALATSGDYRNVYEIDGQRLTHFIDPRTGQSVVGEIASASVLAESCALADALATGMMAAGFEEGMKIATSNNWAVMLIARREGELITAVSPQFEALAAKSAEQR